MKYLISLSMLFMVACGGGSSVEPPKPVINPPTAYELPDQFKYAYNGYGGQCARVGDYIHCSPFTIADSSSVVLAEIEIVDRNDDGDLSIIFKAYNFKTWVQQDQAQFELVRNGGEWSGGGFSMESTTLIDTVVDGDIFAVSGWVGDFDDHVLILDGNLNGADSRGCEVSGVREGYQLELYVSGCYEAGSYSGVMFKSGNKVRVVAFNGEFAIAGYFDLL